MPSWITHLVVANRICDKVNIKQRNEFIFANIMPDILEGYHIKNVSKIIKDYSTHYPSLTNINGIDIFIPDLKKFKLKYKNQFDNPIIYGYYSHLITDYYWNKYTYEKYFEDYDKSKHLVKIMQNNNHTQILDFDEAVKIKQKDFNKFSNYLKNSIKLKPINYNDKILEYSKAIKEFSFTTKDINETINYINKSIEFNEKYIEEQYEFFTKPELLEQLDECVKFLIKHLV